MRKVLLYALLYVSLSAFLTKDADDTYTNIPYNSFGRGEVLEYKVNFGLFTVGKSQIKVYDKMYKINHRECYKVDIFGKTSGMVDWVAKVDDNWGAYVDSAALVPHISYRKIKENNYRKNEVVKFDHKTDVIEAKVVDNKTGEFKEPLYISAPNNVRDFLAGYLYLRAIDFNRKHVGDTIVINGFFEDTLYDLQVIYAGKEKVKTKAGKFNAIKLVPVVPDNKLFDGENSVTAWVTDDENKMPVKIKADMFIGSAGIELINYEGVKNKINFYSRR